MDFAKKILNKYGWKEGTGLGKNNDGITKPLKANLKFDNAGLGADQAASDFNNHWWERVFNEAAQNVQVEEQQNGEVIMNLKDRDDAVEISTKGYSLKKLKKAKQATENGDHSDMSGAHYNNFLKSSTLTKTGDEIENPHRIMDSDIAVSQHKILSDDELFRACGGRTAHKGARHGLKLSGKLLRLEQQEKELLSRMQVVVQENVKSDAEAKTRHKRTKYTTESDNPITTENTNNASESECGRKKKTKLGIEMVSDSSGSKSMEKKKKHKSSRLVEIADVSNTTNTDKNGMVNEQRNFKNSLEDVKKEKQSKRKERDKLLGNQNNNSERDTQFEKPKKKKHKC